MANDAPTSWTLELISERLQGTLSDMVGFQPLLIERGQCRAYIDHKPSVTQGGGLFHAGAFITLADAAATFAALTITDPDATRDASRFPLAIQVSVNLIRNADHGRITADARVLHGGRTTQIVETSVTDEEGRLMAKVTTTHMVVPNSDRRQDDRTPS